MTTSKSSTLSAARRQVEIASGIVISTALIVTMGWIFDLPALTSFVAGSPPMQPDTALVFLFFGVLLHLSQRAGGHWMRLATLGTFAVLMVALLSLVTYLPGLNFGAELLPRSTFTTWTAASHRMSPQAAVAFLFAGMAFLLRRMEILGGFRPAPYLAGAVWFIALVSLIGYLYRFTLFYASDAYIGLSLPTTLAFFALGWGVLAVAPESAFMTLALRPSVGGLMLRRLLPALAVLPFGLGWFSFLGERAGIQDAALGKAIMVALTVLLMGLLIWRNAKSFESREQEARLRLFIDQAPAAVAMFDRQMRYLAASRRWIEDFRIEVPVTGSSQYDIFPEIPERWREVHRRALNGEVVASAEDRFDRADGSVQWLRWETRPWRDEDGVIGGIMIFSQDISGAKRAEEALRKNEQSLADDLKAMTRLQKMATFPILDGHIGPVLEEIVDAAIAISGADFGNIQILDQKSQLLRIEVHRGFPAWWLEFWESTDKGWGTCGTAFERGERVIVEDIEQSPIFVGTPALDIQRKAGVRAIQSSPLLSRSGQILGILSTHYRTPRRPDERVLRLLDLLARQTADIVERAQSEAAIRESEEVFRAMFETSSVGKMESEVRTGYFLRVNDAFCKLTGYSREELMKKKLLDIVHPEDPAAELDSLNRFALGEIPAYEQEKRLLRSDGAYAWALVTLNVIHDPDGQPLRLSGVIQDISERRRAREALYEANQRLETLMNALPVGVSFSNDATCRQVTGNTAVLAQFEALSSDNLSASAPEPTATGRQIRFFRNGRMVRYSELPLQRAVAENREIPPVELEIHLPSGRRWFASASGAPLYNLDGQVIGGVAVTVDITERKLAVDALSASEKRFRAVFEHAAIGIAITDPEGRFQQCNPAYCKLLGYSEEELRQIAFSELIHPDDRAANLTEIRRLKEDEQPYFEIENRYLRKDGEPVWVRKFVSQFLDTTGGAAHLVALVTDMTEHRRMEQALRDADRRKDEFLAMLAHELRNPLAPICNGLSLLRNIPSQDPAIERVHVILERQVGHLVRLVDDLMEASRITRGKITLLREACDLAEIILSAVEASQPHIDAAGLALETSLPAQPLAVDGDKVRLAQVFANLLNNAAKFTEPGGRIRIGVSRRNGEAMVSVRDSGIGIPVDKLPHVFELFAQFDHSHAQVNNRGVGIGLALVRGLVEMHGGRVEALSEGIGRGSEFIVHLPLADVAVSKTEAADPRPLEAPAPSRILIVDDNCDAAISLGMLLQSMNAETKVVFDGKAALACLQDFKPELVLMDLGMPEMDGYEAARQIRRDPAGRDLTLIALTGWSQEEDRRKTREAGFDHHLIKPVDVAQLIGVLDAAHRRA